jgi:hypothetical protein
MIHTDGGTSRFIRTAPPRIAFAYDPVVNSEPVNDANGLIVYLPAAKAKEAASLSVVGGETNPNMDTTG